VQARAVVTASGAQFGLTTGLVVFVRGKEYSPDQLWSWVFGAALALYLISVAFGLVASRSHKTAVAALTTLRQMLSNHWTDDSVTAKNFIAQVQVKSIEALREGNNIKARWLKYSVIIQVVAIAILAAAVVGVTR